LVWEFDGFLGARAAELVGRRDLTWRMLPTLGTSPNEFGEMREILARLSMAPVTMSQLLAEN
jgi:hypothetical protein